MSELTPVMLWESTDAQVALQQRFRFVSSAQATQWLTGTIANTYAIPVPSVDRLVISADNLLAWVTTADGPLIAKCCAQLTIHTRLARIADLLCWLEAQGLPVSTPLSTTLGARQVRCEHLSLGLQRLIPGEMLEPTDLLQAHSAGAILAQVHHLLSIYPRASDFSSPPPHQSPRLDERIVAWAETYVANSTDPALVAECHALIEQIRTTSLPTLTEQLVHNDYRAANLLWQAGTLRAVLDFESLSVGNRVNDLAWGAVHLGTRFHHWRPVSAAVHAAFGAGYATILPLSPAEAQWFPLLMRWHELNLAASIAREVQ